MQKNFGKKRKMYAETTFMYAETTFYETKNLSAACGCTADNTI